MKIVILTRWGLISIKQPMTNFYINWDWIQNAVNNEQYIISIWFFKNIPHMFKNGYVILSNKEIQNKAQVKKLIQKLETVEDITLSNNTKNKILDKADVMFQQNDHLFIKMHLNNNETESL